MASHGIRDRVAVVGMGCTTFGEHWDKGADDLLVDAVGDALASAGVEKDQRRRVLGRHDGLGHLRAHALAPVAHRLQAGHARREHVRDRLGVVPQRVLRGGVRRVRHRDGHRRREAEGRRLLRPGRSARRRPTAPRPSSSAPALFSLLGPAYCKKYGVDADEFKDVLTRIAWKNHQNGALNPRAQFRKEVAKETIACSPIMAGNLGIFDCSGVSDGAAAAVIVRAEDAHQYTDKPLYREGRCRSSPGPATGVVDTDYDYTTFPEVVRRGDATRTSRRASPTRAPSSRWPRCTTASRRPSSCSWRTSASPTAASRGRRCSPAPSTSTASCRSTPTAGSRRSATRSARRGCACSSSAGSSCAARPGSARSRRSTAGKKLALTHNLGGSPGECVSYVGVVGSEPAG